MTHGLKATCHRPVCWSGRGHRTLHWIISALLTNKDEQTVHYRTGFIVHISSITEPEWSTLDCSVPDYDDLWTLLMTRMLVVSREKVSKFEKLFSRFQAAPFLLAAVAGRLFWLRKLYPNGCPSIVCLFPLARVNNDRSCCDTWPSILGQGQCGGKHSTDSR